MERIIDLKNKKNSERLPEEGQVSPVPQTSPPPSQTHTIISWSEEINKNSNPKDILGVAGILFVIAILVAIFQKNIISTVFFTLLGIVVILNAYKKPRLSSFEINPAGIKINERFFIYNSLQSFWIEYDNKLGIKELSLQIKKWYLPYVKIPITEQNPVQIRLALLEFLPEVEHKDTLVEILARKLGIY